MKSKWFSHSSVADWIKTIEFLKNNGSVFLPGLHFADFLEKLLALDSEQDELLYRICKLNLCLCQAHTQRQDTGEEKWLGEIFCHLWIFFYRKKSHHYSFISYLILYRSPRPPFLGPKPLTVPEIYSRTERGLSPFLNIQKIIANQS